MLREGKFVMLRPKHKSVLASFLALILLTTQLWLPEPSWAAAIPALNLKLPSGVKNIVLPTELGKIEEAYQGPGKGLVVLVQDAHAVPDAQKSIQKIIHYFQQKHGVSLVALEGAPGDLDPELFRNFPDTQKLRQVFKEYLERGELTGTTAAAIFNPEQLHYTGVENWELYEAGLAWFLRAKENEPAILAALTQRRQALENQKQKAYSAELLKIDQALDSFRKEKADLLSVLSLLASLKAPEPGSELASLLQQAQRDPERGEKLDREVRLMAVAIQKKLRSAVSGADHKLEMEFQGKYQEFLTSLITPEQLALVLQDIAARMGLKLKFSEALLAHTQREIQVRQIEGTRLFRDFDRYARSVKETLFENDAERLLDQETDALYRLERLARLVLDQEDWQAIQKQKLGVEEPALRELFKPALAFYQNAKQRDHAFFDNLKKKMRSDDQAGALLIAGGFHTEGLSRLLRDEGLSHVVIMPSIQSLPEVNHYAEQMYGGVSWKKYFKVKNGKLNFYEAFVRGTRDRLLGPTGVSSGPQAVGAGSKPAQNSFDANGGGMRESPLLLKRWRDAIIRNLSRKGRISEAGKYTRFLDEWVKEKGPASAANDLESEWLANIERFMDGMRGLETQNTLTPKNVARLLNVSGMGSGFTYSQLVSKSEVRTHGVLNFDGGSLSAGSEAVITPEVTQTGPAAAGSETTRQIVRQEFLAGTFSEITSWINEHVESGAIVRMLPYYAEGEWQAPKDVFLERLQENSFGISYASRHNLRSVVTKTIVDGKTVYSVLLSEQESRGTSLTSDEMITVYHATTVGQAQSILTEGKYQLPERWVLYANPQTPALSRDRVWIAFRIPAKDFWTDGNALAFKFDSDRGEAQMGAELRAHILVEARTQKRILPSGESTLPRYYRPGVETAAYSLVMAEEAGLLTHVPPQAIDIETTLALLEQRQRDVNFKGDHAKLAEFRQQLERMKNVASNDDVAAKGRSEVRQTVVAMDAAQIAEVIPRWVGSAFFEATMQEGAREIRHQQPLSPYQREVIRVTIEGDPNRLEAFWRYIETPTKWHDVTLQKLLDAFRVYIVLFPESREKMYARFLEFYNSSKKTDISMLSVTSMFAQLEQDLRRSEPKAAFLSKVSSVVDQVMDQMKSFKLEAFNSATPLNDAFFSLEIEKIETIRLGSILGMHSYVERLKTREVSDYFALHLAAGNRNAMAVVRMLAEAATRHQSSAPRSTAGHFIMNWIERMPGMDPTARALLISTVPKLFKPSGNSKWDENKAADFSRQLTRLFKTTIEVEDALRVLLEWKDTVQEKDFLGDFQTLPAELAYVVLDYYQDKPELLEAVIRNDSTHPKVRIYAYGLLAKAHQENEQPARLATLLEDQRLGRVLGQSIKEFFNEVQKDPWGEILAGPAGYYEMSINTTAILLWSFQNKMLPFLNTPQALAPHLERAVSPAILYDYNNANSEFEFGFEMISKTSRPEVLLTVAHELMHRILGHEFNYDSDGIQAGSVHELMSDWLAKALAKRWLWHEAIQEYDHSVHVDKNYAQVTQGQGLGTEVHQVARAQQKIIEQAHEGYDSIQYRYLFEAAAKILRQSDSRGLDFYDFVKEVLLIYGENQSRDSLGARRAQRYDQRPSRGRGISLLANQAEVIPLEGIQKLIGYENRETVTESRWVQRAAEEVVTALQQRLSETKDSAWHGELVAGRSQDDQDVFLSALKSLEMKNLLTFETGLDPGWIKPFIVVSVTEPRSNTKLKSWSFNISVSGIPYKHLKNTEFLAQVKRKTKEMIRSRFPSRSEVRAVEQSAKAGIFDENSGATSPAETTLAELISGYADSDDPWKLKRAQKIGEFLQGIRDEFPALEISAEGFAAVLRLVKTHATSEDWENLAASSVGKIVRLISRDQPAALDRVEDIYTMVVSIHRELWQTFGLVEQGSDFLKALPAEALHLQTVNSDTIRLETVLPVAAESPAAKGVEADGERPAITFEKRRVSRYLEAAAVEANQAGLAALLAAEKTNLLGQIARSQGMEMREENGRQEKRRQWLDRLIEVQNSRQFNLGLRDILKVINSSLTEYAGPGAARFFELYGKQIATAFSVSPESTGVADMLADFIRKSRTDETGKTLAEFLAFLSNTKSSALADLLVSQDYLDPRTRVFQFSLLDMVGDSLTDNERTQLKKTLTHDFEPGSPAPYRSFLTLRVFRNEVDYLREITQATGTHSHVKIAAYLELLREAPATQDLDGLESLLQSLPLEEYLGQYANLVEQGRQEGALLNALIRVYGAWIGLRISRELGLETEDFKVIVGRLASGGVLFHRDPKVESNNTTNANSDFKVGVTLLRHDSPSGSVATLGHEFGHNALHRIHIGTPSVRAYNTFSHGLHELFSDLSVYSFVSEHGIPLDEWEHASFLDEFVEPSQAGKAGKADDLEGHLLARRVLKTFREKYGLDAARWAQLSRSVFNELKEVSLKLQLKSHEAIKDLPPEEAEAYLLQADHLLFTALAERAGVSVAGETTQVEVRKQILMALLERNRGMVSGTEGTGNAVRSEVRTQEGTLKLGLSRRDFFSGSLALSSLLFFSGTVNVGSESTLEERLGKSMQDVFKILKRESPLKDDAEFKMLFSDPVMTGWIQAALEGLEIRSLPPNVPAGAIAWENGGRIFLSAEWIGSFPRDLRDDFLSESSELAFEELIRRVNTLIQQQQYIGSQEERLINAVFMPILGVVAHELRHVYQHHQGELKNYTGGVDDAHSGLRELEAYRFEKKVEAGFATLVGLIKEYSRSGFARDFFSFENASQRAGNTVELHNSAIHFFKQTLLSSSARDLIDFNRESFNRNAAEALFLTMSLLRNAQEGYVQNDKEFLRFIPSIVGMKKKSDLEPTLLKGFEIIRGNLDRSATEILDTLDKAGVNGEYFEKFLSSSLAPQVGPRRADLLKGLGVAPAVRSEVRRQTLEAPAKQVAGVTAAQDVRIVRNIAAGLVPGTGHTVTLSTAGFERLIQRYLKEEETLAADLKAQPSVLVQEALQKVLAGLRQSLESVNPDSQFTIAFLSSDRLTGSATGELSPLLRGYLGGVVGQPVAEILQGGLHFPPAAITALRKSGVNLRQGFNPARSTKAVLGNADAVVPVAGDAQAFLGKINPMFAPLWVNNIKALQGNKDALYLLGELMVFVQIHVAALSLVSELKENPEALKKELLKALRLNEETYAGLISLEQGQGLTIGIDAAVAGILLRSEVRKAVAAAA